MPTRRSLQAVLRAKIEKLFYVADKLGITRLEYRELLRLLATQQLSYSSFMKKIKAVFPPRSEFIRVLCELRSFVTAHPSAVNFLQRHAEDVDSIGVKMAVLQIFQDKIKTLTIVPRQDNEVSVVMQQLLSVFEEPDVVANDFEVDMDDIPASGNTFLVDLKKAISAFHVARQKGDKEGVEEHQQRVRELIVLCQRAEKYDLSGYDLSYLDLSGLDLNNMDFSASLIDNTNFSDSSLVGAQFQGVDRKNRHEVKASFSGANCRETNFSCCNLRESVFDDKTQVDDMTLQGSRLSRDNLIMFLPHAQWWQSDANGRPRLSLENTSLEDENLSRLNLSGLYLRRVYFRGANLLNTQFGDSDVTGCDFQKVKNLGLRSLDECVGVNSIQLTKLSSKKRKKEQQVAKSSQLITGFFGKRRAAGARAVPTLVNSL